jgi:hypothetical protein
MVHDDECLKGYSLSEILGGYNHANIRLRIHQKQNDNEETLVIKDLTLADFSFAGDNIFIDIFKENKIEKPTEKRKIPILCLIDTEKENNAVVYKDGKCIFFSIGFEPIFKSILSMINDCFIGLESNYEVTQKHIKFPDNLNDFASFQEFFDRECFCENDTRYFIGFIPHKSMFVVPMNLYAKKKENNLVNLNDLSHIKFSRNQEPFLYEGDILVFDKDNNMLRGFPSFDNSLTGISLKDSDYISKTYFPLVTKG